MKLRPFWSYYGGKAGAAKLYPRPEYDTIIEPFAGAAGYSTCYYWKKIQLYDVSPIICGLWDYLIHASSNDIRQLPIEFDHVDDLSVCQEAKWLIGFYVNTGSSMPKKSRSKRAKENKDKGTAWGIQARNRLARQIEFIRHWTIKQSDYADIVNTEATWFIDPPYNNKAGSYYQFHVKDYAHLGQWCKDRLGQVMVCENDGADWLPFRPFAKLRSSAKDFSNEVIWTNREEQKDVWF